MSCVFYPFAGKAWRGTSSDNTATWVAMKQRWSWSGSCPSSWQKTVGKRRTCVTWKTVSVFEVFSHSKFTLSLRTAEPKENHFLNFWQTSSWTWRWVLVVLYLSIEFSQEKNIFAGKKHAFKCIFSHRQREQKTSHFALPNSVQFLNPVMVKQKVLVFQMEVFWSKAPYCFEICKATTPDVLLVVFF